MSVFNTSYLVPAILLNPAFVLHLFNTFISHWMPPPYTPSVSPHPFMESLGPLPGTKIAVDVHANEQLCWSYTAVMVVIQCLAFGKVQDNRVRRRSAKAARLERERLRKEKKSEEERAQIVAKIHMASSHMNREIDLDGTCGEEKYANGNGHVQEIEGDLLEDVKITPLESEGSTTETSEEEMML